MAHGGAAARSKLGRRDSRALPKSDALGEEGLVDLSAADSHDVAMAVDHKALRQLVGTVGVRKFTSRVAQVGVGEVVLPHEALRVGRGVAVGDAEHGRVVALELAL